MAVAPRFSVVVTLYQSEAMLPAVIERITDLQAELDCPVEAVFVVDDSPDNSAATLRRLLSEPRPFDSQLILLSRNFGAVNAGRTGVEAATGDVIATHASDLQEPLSLFVDFYRALTSGEYDVAFGIRRSRVDPWRSRIGAELYWKLYRRFVQRNMPKGGVDIFACTRQVANEISALRETHSSIIGLLLWVGFRRIDIPYDRLERRVGKSSWTLRKRVRYFLDSVFSFSDLPVHIFTAVGATGVIVSIVVAILVFAGWAAGAISVAGYTTIMLTITTLGSGILLALGIIGSYVWRTYENSKMRPFAIPLRRERFPARSQSLPSATEAPVGTRPAAR